MKMLNLDTPMIYDVGDVHSVTLVDGELAFFKTPKSSYTETDTLRDVLDKKGVAFSKDYPQGKQNIAPGTFAFVISKRVFDKAKKVGWVSNSDSELVDIYLSLAAIDTHQRETGGE